MLTFLLVLIPIAFVGAIIGYATDKVSLPSGVWGWPYMLLDGGLTVWMYLLHWKMRAINKRLQLPTMRNKAS